MVSEKTENFINQFRQNRIFFLGGGGEACRQFWRQIRDTDSALCGAVHYKEPLKSFAKSRA